VRVDVVTLFPELFTSFFEVSFVGRAREVGALQTRTRSPREFGLGNHRSIDDTPYGGGSGMVMRVDCLLQTIEALDAEAPASEPRAHRVLLTPQGTPFHQRKAVELSQRHALVLICGRYEGFDARLNDHIDEEISLGDFVMTGGEVAAMAVIESTVRLLPGVLGNADSTREESHSLDAGGLLEYPQYTRPLSFRGHEVPEVLRSGNHAAIAAWRHQRSRELTAARRPELLAAYDLAHPPPPPKRPRRKKKPAAGASTEPAAAPADPREVPDETDLPRPGAFPGAGPRRAAHHHHHHQPRPA
jgi:tRNA (guanine37-N1)-methyltransferase